MTVFPVARMLGTVAVLATPPVFAADLDAAILASSCALCHGPGGQSPGAIPRLDTLAADEMAGALANFAADTRPSTVMGRIARGYSADELVAISVYLAEGGH